MYNRQQRRRMEKQLGLRKQFANMSATEKAEMRKRKMESGKQIHLQNVQAREQYEQAFEAEMYQKKIASFQESGMTIEEATAHVDSIYALENAKWEKRYAKRTNTRVYPTE